MSQTASLVSTLRGASESSLGACCKSRSGRGLRSPFNHHRYRSLQLHELIAKNYVTSDSERIIPIIQSIRLSLISSLVGLVSLAYPMLKVGVGDVLWEVGLTTFKHTQSADAERGSSGALSRSPVMCC